jgi:hypothetical protein
MAATLVALQESRDILPLFHEIWFSGLMGEEAGQQAKALAAREKFDPRSSASRPGCKSSTPIRALHGWRRAHGRAAHASTPQNEKMPSKNARLLGFCGANLSGFRFPK